MLATLLPLSVEFNDSFRKLLVEERWKYELSICDYDTLSTGSFLLDEIETFFG